MASDVVPVFEEVMLHRYLAADEADPEGADPEEFTALQRLDKRPGTSIDRLHKLTPTERSTVYAR